MPEAQALLQGSRVALVPAPARALGNLHSQQVPHGPEMRFLDSMSS